MKKIKSALFLLALWPITSFAQGTTPLKGTTSFFSEAQIIVQTILIPMAFTLALLFFFWGVAKYILKAGSEKEEGRKIMVWGVIALFVISSIWGIVYFLRVELGVDDDSSIPIPTLD